MRKQIRPRPSGFELNQYEQYCKPVMKNSSSERKTKNTQDCQKLKFYQIQINSDINQCFLKRFWCWCWRNGLDYSNIPFFVVYGKSPQGITQSCTSLSQPLQPCCPSGWTGGSAGSRVTLLHSREACTQPCNVNTHSRAHCSPGARPCEQWEPGCVNNGARLCASARLCRGSPVRMRLWNSVFAELGSSC